MLIGAPQTFYQTGSYVQYNLRKLMEDEKRDNARISGRTDGPYASDDTDVDRPAEDNRNRYIDQDSANGLDSQEVRGGQDGRNERGVASTDMDSKNGLLRMDDNSNSTMEVTKEGMESAISEGDKTNTSMVDVTTAGPDDYASADEVGTPEAEKAAKEQNDSEEKDELASEEDKRIAETGTDITNQPAY